MNQDASQPVVVYHVAAMGNWKEVVLDQLNLFRECGLTAIRVTHVGPDLAWLRRAFGRFGVGMELVRSEPNTDHYETLAMLEVERLAKAERVDLPILYLHTKGVSNPEDHGKWLWRKVMEEHLVRPWRANAAALADHDAVGVNWHQHGEQHFSGNFWLARPDWIRRLPDFVAYHHAKGLVRYSCEMWIGAAHWCRAKSLACADEPFWYGGYDFRRLMPQAVAPAAPAGAWAKPRLSIVTACSRPANLPHVGRSVDSLRDRFDVTWVVVLDLTRAAATDVSGCRPDVLVGEPGDGHGMAQKNRGLAEAADGWIYFVDDDNLVHPEFAAAAAAAIAANPDRRVFVFGQRNRDGTVRLDAGPVAWGRIDVGSFMVHRSVVGRAVFARHPDGIGDDFVFIDAIREASPEAFAFVHSCCTFYNAMPDFVAARDGCPVPLLQEEWEFTTLMELFDRVRPRNVLEIGSLYGGTLWHWLRRPWVEKVLSVDLLPRATDAWHDPLWHGEFLAAARSKWAGWVEDRPDRLVSLLADSTHPATAAEVSTRFPNRTLDWLYIDGGHDYETVRSDWETYSPLVGPGGHVVFHDLSIPDVARLWGEVAHHRRTVEISRRRGAWGVGVVFVGD